MTGLPIHLTPVLRRRRAITAAERHATPRAIDRLRRRIALSAACGAFAIGTTAIAAALDVITWL